MWQLLLAAAAAAGSTSLVARHLFSPNAKSCKKDNQNEKHTNPFDDDVKYQSPVVARGTNVCGYESNCEKEEGIFRFSSSESGGKSGFRSESKSKEKGGRGAKKMEKEKRSGGVKARRRRVAVCLKKMRTAKNGSCSTKDSSLFHWGLGVGIMYMMSARKSEITELNIAVDETAKVVQELKSELIRRKSSRSLQGLSSQNDLAAISEKIRSKHTEKGFVKSETESRDANNIKVFGCPSVEDGECGNSILTDERDPELQEMDQLEAELQSELQKLPWWTREASYHEDMKLNKPEGQSSDCFQTHGVSPSELNQKLSHLLIEQQGNQIVDLESELHLAQTKLYEKEAELQALKDCVKRLTEFSLSTVPASHIDDETETQEEQVCRNEWDCNSEAEFEPRQQVVGMKRHIDTESWSYYVE
ncbi:uncharacterized protein LOC123215679 isoform X2 [Mangifera indica]|uniref:uncharacterized protein LOC123215679 isoform X2 n=1 Tax=Mangifera indica TaxID=29780 RepID=UPI001CFB1A4C|nr:uncharacterized protein LOC123215679 isoform X2 [Mangifera indica]